MTDPKTAEFMSIMDLFLERHGRGHLSSRSGRLQTVERLREVRRLVAGGYVPPKAFRETGLRGSLAWADSDQGGHIPKWAHGALKVLIYYKGLERTCARCIDYLRLNHPSCPYCDACLRPWQGERTRPFVRTDDPNAANRWLTQDRRRRVEVEVDGVVRVAAVPQTGGGMSRDQWIATFRGGIELRVTGPVAFELERARVLRVLGATGVRLQGPKLSVAIGETSSRPGIPLLRLGRPERYADE